MAIEHLDTELLDHITKISKKLIEKDSAFDVQLKKLEEYKLTFGLTNAEFAEMASKIHVTATEFLTKYATSSAMELLKLELNQPLLDAQISLAQKELELKDKDLTLKDKDIALKELELAIKAEELEIKKQELEIAKEKLKLIEQQVLESKAKVELIEAQVITEGKQQSMIVAQTTLVNRQTDGYGDNMLVKAAEFQGGLASFAVNSDSDSAQAAISAFNITIDQMKSRA